MITKVVRVRRLDDTRQLREDLEYWSKKSPSERVAAVDYLRRQVHGSATRLQELLALFNGHGVEYLIVGGYALAYHGAPRYTGDMDVFVKADTNNASRILAALSDFGFGSLGLTVEDFALPDKVVQLGYPPVRVNIVTSISGVSWDEARGGAVADLYGDVPVIYIGREHLVVNKRSVGRKKDLADLEALGEE